MTAYYNEFDQYVADWLENLIYAGYIAPGVVDTRSIEDVRPSDLAGFKQCHFFAGLGGWSYALRAAGWADDRPVWTGSCPCQPFSTAGEGAGFADERHLWPHFGYLIAQRKPAVVLGEQVASAAVDAWIDLVHADLDAVGYAFGSVPFPSAGVGAPHIRDRNYWVATRLDNTNGQRLAGHRLRAENKRSDSFWPADGSARPSSIGSGLANAHGSAGGQGRADVRGRSAGSDAQSRAGLGGGGGVLERLADADGGIGWDGEIQRKQQHGLAAPDGGSMRETSSRAQARVAGAGSLPGPTNGFWRAADWLACRDGKWRPVEPGTFPLADGATSRVGRLRAYGNAINVEAAKAWIETVMECMP